MVNLTKVTVGNRHGLLVPSITTDQEHIDRDRAQLDMALTTLDLGGLLICDRTGSTFEDWRCTRRTQTLSCIRGGSHVQLQTRTF